MHTIGSLCTGYGGLDMAVMEIFPSRVAWWADNDPGVRRLMGKHHAGLPNLGDVTTANWSAVEPVSIVTAGYPCQPFSNAGRRLGTSDERHLWPWIAECLRVLRPKLVVLENVAAHLRRGFDVVAQDLAELGYQFAWAVVSAAEVGAPHLRKRLFVVAADASRELLHRPLGGRPLRRAEHSDGGVPPADSPSDGRNQGQPEQSGNGRRPVVADGRRDPSPAPFAREREPVQDWRQYSAAVERWERRLNRTAPVPTAISDRGGRRVLSPLFVEWMMGLREGHVTGPEGLPRAQRLKMLGNGVVPQQAAHAIWHLLAILALSVSPS